MKFLFTYKPTLKNALRLFLCFAFLLMVSSCVRENAEPPGCEIFKAPATDKNYLEIETGETITLSVAEPGNSKIKVVWEGPNEFTESNSATITIPNADINNDGDYFARYVEDYCKSQPAVIYVKVNLPQINCDVPQNTLQIINKSKEIKFGAIACGVKDSNYQMSGISGLDEIEIVFGRKEAPAEEEIFTVSTAKSISDIYYNQARVKAIIGGYEYITSNPGQRLKVSFDGGKMYVHFCELELSKPGEKLTCSGRFTCN